MILETGLMAKQANGAVVARYGDTVVLATAVDRTTVSPYLATTAPFACLAMSPVSSITRLPPISVSTVVAMKPRFSITVTAVMLFSYAELLNDLTIAVQIVFLKIIQVTPPLADHLQKTSA